MPVKDGLALRSQGRLPSPCPFIGCQQVWTRWTLTALPSQVLFAWVPVNLRWSQVDTRSTTTLGVSSCWTWTLWFALTFWVVTFLGPWSFLLWKQHIHRTALLLARLWWCHARRWCCEIICWESADFSLTAFFQLCRIMNLVLQKKSGNNLTLWF